MTKTCLWQVTPTKAVTKRYKPAYEEQLEQQQLAAQRAEEANQLREHQESLHQQRLQTQLLRQQQLQEKELQLQREAEQGEKFYKNQLRLNSFMYVCYGLCIAWSVLWVLWHPPHHHWKEANLIQVWTVQKLNEVGLMSSFLWINMIAVFKSGSWLVFCLVFFPLLPRKPLKSGEMRAHRS